MTLMNEQNAFIRNIIAYTSKSLYVKGLIYNSTLYMITLNGILFEVDLSGAIDQSCICGFTSETLMSNPDYIIDDSQTRDEVFEKSQNIINMKQNPVIFMNEALRDDPIFEQIATAKSSDGASNYFIATDTGINTFITLYRGILNLNKPDKASLLVYQTIDPKILLAQFNIFKKKINRNYSIYFLFMNFDQRRIL